MPFAPRRKSVSLIFFFSGIEWATSEMVSRDSRRTLGYLCSGSFTLSAYDLFRFFLFSDYRCVVGATVCQSEEEFCGAISFLIFFLLFRLSRH